MFFDILLRRSRVGFFPASATRRARRWTVSLALAVGCCLASIGGAHAHTITWSRVGTVTTLTNGQLCTNDGWNIYCDSTTPTIASGLVGIGSTAPVVSLDLSQKTDALALPVGTSGMRPTGINLANGELRYNSTLSGVETYVNGTWDTVLTAASLGSSLPAAGSTGQVQFNNGGVLGASANFFWDNTNGRVGINTTNPQALLQIGSPYPSDTVGSVPVVRVLGNVQSTTSQTLLRLNRPLSSGLYYSGGVDFNVYSYGAGTASSTQLDIALKSGQSQTETSNVTVMTLRDNGNVGIGTTSPVAALQIVTAGNKGIYLDTPSNTDQLVFLTSNSKKWDQYLVGNDLRFFDYTNNADLVTFQVGGNVGIGNTSPAALLDLGTTLNNTTANSANIQFTYTPASSLYNHSITNEFNSNPALDGIFFNVTENGTAVTPLSLISTGNAVFSGSVGIGETPLVKLDLIGTSIATDSIGTEDEFHITRPVNSGVSWPQVAALQLGTYNSSGSCCGPQTRLDINLKAAANATLTGDTNVMTLLSNGNVGIGTTSPGKPLDVVGDILVGDGQPSSAVFFGGTTSSYPKLIRSGSVLYSYLADSSALAGFNGATISATGSLITTGPNSGVVVDRRDNNASAFDLYSNSGDLQFYSSALSADVMRVTSSGSVGIGTASPNTNAMLQLYSTTEGFLPPLLTTSNETSMGTSLPTGLMVYNTTNNELESFNGTNWEAVGANAADAAGSTGQVQFNNAGDLGADSNFFWDNTNKRLGIGTTSPDQALTINGNLDFPGTANRTISVVNSGSGTAGFNLSISSGSSVSGNVAGGSLNLNGGGSTGTGTPGGINIMGGAAGGNANGGDIILTSGATTTLLAGTREGNISLIGTTESAAASTTTGGSLIFTAGSNSVVSGNVLTGGSGGAMTLTLGSGGYSNGGSLGSGGTGGAGGTFALTGGRGGNDTVSAGAGGAGSSLTFTSGAGGNNSASGGTGGNSGNIVFQIGSAGTGAGTNGSLGNFQFLTGSVGIGTPSPGYALDAYGGNATYVANFQTPSTNSNGTEIQFTEVDPVGGTRGRGN